MLFRSAPDCYYMRCNVQSYFDIAGSGGNVNLVKNLDNFKEYMNYAKTDYVYGNIEYLNEIENERPKELILHLIEDASVYDVIVINNCFYGKVDKERISVSWKNEMTDLQKRNLSKSSEIIGILNDKDG